MTWSKKLLLMKILICAFLLLAGSLKLRKTVSLLPIFLINQALCAVF